MTLSIDIPSDLETALRSEFGAALEDRAKQDLAAIWYSQGRLSARQAATMLGLSLFEVHALLKARGAYLPMSIQDVEADLSSIHDARNL